MSKGDRPAAFRRLWPEREPLQGEFFPCWRYIPHLAVLRYTGRDGWPRYELDLMRTPDAAAVLRQIVEVSARPWATPVVLSDLVSALDAVLGLRANYCRTTADPPGCRVTLPGLHHGPERNEED